MKTKNDLEIRKLIEQEAIDSFMEDREQLRTDARIQITKIQNENRRNYNKNRKEAYQYQIGDHVAIKRTQSGSGLKLKPKNLGPYEVTKKQPNDRYQLQKIGIHEGPFSTKSSADNMSLWPETGYQSFQVNMLRTIGNLWSKLRQKPKKTIIIEGTIGAGKTTVADWLRRNVNASVIPEPLDLWHNLNGFNILEAYYQDPKKWIFPFQMYAMLTMLNRHLQIVPQRLKIMERLIQSCRKCFIPLLVKQKKLDPHAADIFYKFLDFFEDNYDVKIDAIIYMRTSPEIAHERIQTRNRPGEQAITLEYLQDLNGFYDDWLLNERNVPVYEIDSNQTSIAVIQQLSTIIDNI